MTHDEFLQAKDFSLAFEEFKKKVLMKFHNLWFKLKFLILSSLI